MTAQTDGLTGLARESAVTPVATTPVVRTPARADAPNLVPGAEALAAGESRVTVPG